MFLEPPVERIDLQPVSGSTGPDVSSLAEGVSARRATRAKMVDRLLREGEQTLRALDASLVALEARGEISEVEAFPAFGVLAITGSTAAREALLRHPALHSLHPVRTWRLPELPALSASETSAQGTEPVEDRLQGASAGGLDLQTATEAWHLRQTGADEAWRLLGNAGEGVVVAVMDSGADVGHPLLQSRYRGRGLREQDYHWFDAISPGSSPRPIDPLGHGTHVTGLVAGRKGAEAYGVAPGAEWIAARVFDSQGYATDLNLLRGAAWVLAPTRLAGDRPRPELAPDIVNGSWTLDNGADPLMDRVIETWLAADILPVFAAGNLDSSLEPWPRVLAPAGHPNALAVGATMRAGRHWPYSRTGPGFHDVVKPDLSAPGAEVASAWPGDRVDTQSGTSMASPQVAGAAALLLGALPSLRPDELAELLRSNARDEGEVGPDGRYGHGEMDLGATARAVVNTAMLSGKVLDAAGQPVAGAEISCTALSDIGEAPRPRETRSDAAGRYTLPLPAGRWSLRATTLGASSAPETRELRSQERLLFDFALVPRAADARILGRVIDALGRPVRARLRIEGGVHATVAGPDGRFELNVPGGDLHLQISANGHRARRLPLRADGGARPIVLGDIELSSAPSILLVDADAWDNERIHPYLGRALSDGGYAHDLHEIDDLARVPDPLSLSAYDLVIWAQDYGSPGLIDRRRADRGLDAKVVAGLMRYVAEGGRLILSGQEVALHDFKRGQAPELFENLLGVELIRERTLADQRRVSGRGPLDGLLFDLASPRAAPKLRYFAPDSVQPLDDAGQQGRPKAFPLLTYSDGSAAATGRDDEAARLAYLAFGPESGGDREALAALYKSLITWLTPPSVQVEAPTRPIAAGETITATVSLLVERFDAAASLELVLPDSLVHLGDDDFEAADGDGTPAWSGELRGDTLLRLEARLGVEAGHGYPPSRIEARWAASGRSGSESADLTLLAPEMQGSTLSVEPGRSLDARPDAVTVTLRIANTGLAEARDAQAVITLPLGFEVISDSLHAEAGAASFRPEGGVEWRGSIEGSSDVRVSWRGRPNPTPRVQTVDARIAGEGLEIWRSAPFLLASPDLSASDWLDPPKELARSGAFELRFKVINQGQGTATAQVELDLPEGVSAQTSPGESRVFWTGDVAAASERIIEFDLVADAEAEAGTKPFQLKIGDTFSPALDHQRPLSMVFRRPDLGSSQVLMLPARPRAGGLLTTTLLVGNGGDAPAQASIIDSPSPNVVPLAQSLRVSAGSVELRPGAVYWNVDLAPAPESVVWSTEPLTPALSAGGTRIHVPEGSDWSAAVELGLPVPFGDRVYSAARVTRQGALAFDEAVLPAASLPWQELSDLPEESALIAPFWVDPELGEDFEPRLIREQDRAIIIWHRAEMPAFSLEMSALGEFRFAYAAMPQAVPSVIGMRAPAFGVLDLPRDVAKPGNRLRIGAAQTWQRLSYRATLGSSSEPNRRVAHTVRLDGDGPTRVLTASLPVNRLSLRRSTLDAWPPNPAAGARVAYTLSLESEGDVLARQVEARVDLPASFSLESTSLPVGLVHDAESHALFWRGDLMPGQPRRLSWHGQLDEKVLTGGRIVTQAMVSSVGVEPHVLHHALRVDAAAFRGSRQRVSRQVAWPEQTLGFVMQIANSSATAERVTLTNALPDGLEMLPGTLRASAGPAPQWDARSQSLHWTGEVLAGSRVDVSFEARFVADASLVNVMRLMDSSGVAMADWVEIWPAAARLELPIVQRSSARLSLMLRGPSTPE